MTAGRTTLFTAELGARIAERIAEGETLKGICAEYDMPARGTVARWLRDSDKTEFRGEYDRARCDAADAHADEILDLSRTASPENAASVKVRVDALRWLASKRLPRVYGEKSEIRHSGGITLEGLVSASFESPPDNPSPPDTTSPPDDAP